MKILHIIGGGERGGSRAHVITLCAGLRERYRQVDVEIVCLMEGPVARDARRHGIPVRVFPMRYPADWSVLPSVRRHIRDTAPAIVHTHGVRANLIGRLAARGLGSAVITTVHSSMYSDYWGSPKRWLYPWAERRTRRITDRFIAVASCLKDELKRDGVPARRIAVVYNCLPERDNGGQACVSLRHELGIDPRTPIVMSVGRLEAVKNPVALLRVFAALQGRLPFHGVIVGDGSLSLSLRRRARRMGLERDVTFLGFRTDVPALLEQADVLLSTSRMEGLSVALLEAMRARLPLVVTRVGGMGEVVERAHNGFAVPHERLDELADRIEQLLRDPALRADFARRGEEALQRHFSTDAFLCGTWTVYQETLNDSGTVAGKGSAGRVAIAGYYGAGNNGDEAILSGMLEMLKEEGVHDVTVLSFDPANTKRVHRVKSLSIGRRLRGIPAIWRELRQADLFILGGGGLLQDGHSRIVPFWLSRVVLAMLAGTPVMYCALGVGPLRTRSARRLVGLISDRAAMITVRDRGSQAILEDCGVRRPDIEVTADAALCLSVASLERRTTDERVASGTGAVTIAVAPRLLHVEGAFLDAFTRCLQGLRQSRRIGYRFVPLHEREDLPAVEELSRRLAGKEHSSAEDRLLACPRSPEQLAARLAETDGVIAMRLHALVIGALTGIPVFGVAYDPKVENFLESVATLPPCVGMTEVIRDPEGVTARLTSWIDGREMQRERMRPAIEKLRVAARRNGTIAARLIGRAAAAAPP